jgi:23S rRNA (adenine-N6)-dimethyltransferase
VVAAAGVLPGDLVVDVGAGDGALTRPLVEAGARVLAVELHPGRCETLRARFTGEPVTVVHVDAGLLRWPRQPFRVVANPPYAVWRALLRQLLTRDSRLLSADVVLQRRVVRRIVEEAGSSRGTGGREYSFERGLAVPRTDFRPPPRVDSAVLRIRRRT